MLSAAISSAAAGDAFPAAAAEMSAASLQTAGAEAHGAHDAAPAELGERWRRTVVLKRDIFSIVERGTYRGPDGDVDAVLRRIDQVPWWTFLIARNFLAREARAL